MKQKHEANFKVQAKEEKKKARTVTNICQLNDRACALLFEVITGFCEQRGTV
jgi:hypothetical protein